MAKIKITETGLIIDSDDPKFVAELINRIQIKENKLANRTIKPISIKKRITRKRWTQTEIEQLKKEFNARKNGKDRLSKYHSNQISRLLNRTSSAINIAIERYIKKTI